MKSIGIDIGGTFIKFMAIDAQGKVLKRTAIVTDINLSAQAFVKQLATVIKEWQKDFKKEKFVIGIGIAGDTDNTKGILHFAPNIPWHNFKIVDMLEKETSCKCYACNDANMAAWGIYEHEFKKKYKNFIVITLGTGVGGGIILDGKLFQGAGGSAGELGHIKVDYSKTAAKCGCGHKGCLEAYIGTKGLKKQMQEAAKKEPKSILAKLLKEEKFSIKLLSDAASKGDKNAIMIWQNFGRFLALALSDVVLLLNPQAIALAGGVSKGYKYFIPAVKKVFKDQAIKRPFKDLKILVSKEKDIGALGAALYALSQGNEK